MKLVKKLALAGLLVFTLSVKAIAGETQMPAAVPTPSPDRVLAYEDGTSPLGYPCIENTGEITETTDYLFFEALAALLSVY